MCMPRHSLCSVWYRSVVDVDSDDFVSDSIQPPGPNPLANLSEAEIDQEAQKLLDMFDKLNATGVIKV